MMSLEEAIILADKIVSNRKLFIVFYILGLLLSIGFGAATLYYHYL